MGEQHVNSHQQAPDLPGGTPAQLHRVYRKTPVGRWHHPGHHPAFAGYVRIGHLPDGRWWVDSSISEAVGGWLFTDDETTRAEAAARAAVGILLGLRGDGRWREVPALAYDPRTDHRQG